MMKYIVRFLIFSMIIMTSTMVYRFSQQQKVVDAPVIFTFEELGYNNTIVKKSFVRQYENDSKEIINQYSLVIESEISDGSNLGITIDLYYCKNNEQSFKLFEELLRFRKDFLIEMSCDGICYYSSSTFESATADMYKLSNTEWGIDLGFASVDYNDIPEDFLGNYEVFVLKDECVLELTISEKIKLDSQKINSIMNVFARIEEVFTK